MERVLERDQKLSELDDRAGESLNAGSAETSSVYCMPNSGL